MSELNWDGIPANQIPHVWHVVEPWIQDALDYHQRNGQAKYYKEQLECGNLSLWVVWTGDKEIKCVCLTGIAKVDGEWFCHIPIIAGEEMAEWQHLFGILERWAMAQGARYMDIRCRPGFKKFLSKEGYKSTEIILSKDLGGLH